MRCAIYARVSTLDQDPENQLAELRRYVEARGWTPTEYIDRGVSGAQDRRPALDRLVSDAKRRKFDVLVCWRLDRLGRNLKHLITLLDEELQVLGIPFVVWPRVSTPRRLPASSKCTSSGRSRSLSADAFRNACGLASTSTHPTHEPQPAPIHQERRSSLAPCVVARVVGLAPWHAPTAAR